MSTLWNRLGIVVVALLVLAVGVMGWATVDARNRLSRADGRLTRTEAKASAFGKANGEVLSLVISGFDKRLDALEVASTTPFGAPSISNVQASLDDLRNCVNDAVGILEQPVAVTSYLGDEFRTRPSVYPGEC